MQLSGRYSASSLLDEILKPISEAEPETNRMHAAPAVVVFIFSFRQFRGLERAEATTARRKPSKRKQAIACRHGQAPSSSNACSN